MLDTILFIDVIKEVTCSRELINRTKCDANRTRWACLVDYQQQQQQQQYSWINAGVRHRTVVNGRLLFIRWRARGRPIARRNTPIRRASAPIRCCVASQHHCWRCCCCCWCCGVKISTSSTRIAAAAPASHGFMNPHNVRPWVFNSEHCMASWHEGNEETIAPLNFSSSEIFLSEVQTLKLKIPHFGQFKGKIEIVSIRYLVCYRKFIALCRKSQILPTPFHLAPSFGVTPFEFMEKLYGSWN